MSDSGDLLPDNISTKCEKITSGLFNKTEKRKYKTGEGNKLKKSKAYEEEEEIGDIGIDTAITSNKKDFKLQGKRSYKKETSQQKSCGMSSTSAVESNIVKSKRPLKTKGLQIKAKETKLTKDTPLSILKIHKDYYKAQHICEFLDFKHNVKSPNKQFFWSKTTRDAIKKKNRKGKELEEYAQEEEDEISEAAVNDIEIYLREHYKYCMYCGDYVIGEGECTFCPGYFPPDHEEEI